MIHTIVPPHFTLESFLSPLTVSDFLQYGWQQQVVCLQDRHVPNDDDDPLFPKGHLESLRSHTRLSSEDIQYYKSPDALHHNKSSDFVDASYSMVLNNIQWNSDICQSIVDGFQAILPFRSQVNLYITPACHRGLPIHFDWMDVFILQINGSKEWTMYDPLIPLPRPDMLFPMVKFPETIMSVMTLAPGDLLYIPAGIPHQAKALAQDSWHITVGVETTFMGSWESLLIDVLIDLTHPTRNTSNSMSDDASTFSCPSRTMTSFQMYLQNPLVGNICNGDMMLFMIRVVGTHHMELRKSVPFYSSSILRNDLEATLTFVQTHLDMEKGYRFQHHNLKIFDVPLQQQFLKYKALFLDPYFTSTLDGIWTTFKCFVSSNPVRFVKWLNTSLTRYVKASSKRPFTSIYT